MSAKIVKNNFIVKQIQNNNKRLAYDYYQQCNNIRVLKLFGQIKNAMLCHYLYANMQQGWFYGERFSQNFRRITLG
ncbi:MAG: hypothetical protein IKZ88_08150 [Neisseriaceae bacterium]|nr:hypothetical protein [Neisseriaceae bacterium]